jgi:hypothetical protein
MLFASFVIVDRRREARKYMKLENEQPDEDISVERQQSIHGKTSIVIVDDISEDGHQHIRHLSMSNTT